MALHLQENNSESLGHLESNEQKFSDQCLMIVNLLNQGVRLTVKKAIDEYGIASLPRRLADIKHRNGIHNIRDEWVKDGNGKRLYKEWFIVQPTRPTKGEVIQSFTKQLGMKITEVMTRDGEVLKMGDEVTTDWHEKCVGQTFVICEMNAWSTCESGVLVVAHLKGDPSRRIEGFKKEGIDLGPSGIDANHYRPAKK